MARPRAASTRVVTVAEQHGRKFRNKYVVDGEPVSDSFETEDEAVEAAKKFQREHANESGPTVNALIENWIAMRKVAGIPDARSTRYGLALMLDGVSESIATTITPAHMQSAYERAQSAVSKRTGKPLSVATHQEALKITRRFWNWAVEKKHVRKNPCDGLKPIGKRKKRKPQIETMTELQRFKECGYLRAYGGDRVALAVLLALYLGPRSNEVRSIQKRHVDRAYRRLVLPGTKSDNAHRAVVVASDELWELICREADKLSEQTDRLFRTQAGRFCNG